MQGHVIKRGSTYSTVVDLPPAPDGKRRQKWTSGFATRKQAQLALAQLVIELGTGTYVEPARRTVEQYLHDDWLPASAARVRPSTLRGYRQLLDSYVIPFIGQRRLHELDPLTLTKLYGRLLTTPQQRQPGTFSPPHRALHPHRAAPGLPTRSAGGCSPATRAGRSASCSSGVPGQGPVKECGGKAEETRGAAKRSRPSTSRSSAYRGVFVRHDPRLTTTSAVDRG